MRHTRWTVDTAGIASSSDGDSARSETSRANIDDTGDVLRRGRHIDDHSARLSLRLEESLGGGVNWAVILVTGALRNSSGGCLGLYLGNRNVAGRAGRSRNVRVFHPVIVVRRSRVGSRS